MDRSVVDKLALRRAFGNFVTGVTIVTAMDEVGRPRGLTVNSFTSVSLDPPLVLVCIADTAQSCDAFRRCSGFSVNVLHEEQRRYSDIFASKSPDKFERVEWSPGFTGAPRIAGSLAAFDCAVHERVQAGDHMILIGRIACFESCAGRPLVYGQGGYISVSVQQAAVARPSGRDVIVSCVADYEGRILLHRTQYGAWRLPEAVQAGASTSELVTLNDALKNMGAKVEITFLYSVFEIAGENAVAIVYRGTLNRPIEESRQVRLCSEAEVPWDELEPKECQGLLKRFFHDRKLDQFSIYSDVLNEPRVARLQQDPPRSWDSYTAQFDDGSGT